MAFTFFDDCAQNAGKMADQIVEFLKDNPDTLVWRKRVKPDPATKEGQAKIRNKMIEEFSKFPYPKEPNTVPDDIVSEILEKHYKVQDVDRAVHEHRLAMSAENFVGSVLEMYILSKTFATDLCLCPNAVVKSVDFVQRSKDGGWIALQVKNRDNSENSSSKFVRVGTDIKHWFRTFSKTGESNWNNFPEETARLSMSDDDFHSFVESYLKHHPDTT